MVGRTPFKEVRGEIEEGGKEGEKGNASEKKGGQVLTKTNRFWVYGEGENRQQS